MVGGLGLAPGLCVGQHQAMAQATHGSAPDIAGKGIANPLAQILSLGMMLRYTFNLTEAADRVENAVRKALDTGLRTGDIAMKSEKVCGTREMGDAVIANM